MIDVQSRCSSRLLNGRTRTATFTDDMIANYPAQRNAKYMTLAVI